MERSLGGLQMASNGLIVSHLYQGLFSSVAVKIQLLLLKNSKILILKVIERSLGGLQMVSNGLIVSY